jgi:hypothetical protein
LASCEAPPLPFAPCDGESDAFRRDLTTSKVTMSLPASKLFSKPGQAWILSLSHSRDDSFAVCPLHCLFQVAGAKAMLPGYLRWVVPSLLMLSWASGSISRAGSSRVQR